MNTGNTSEWGSRRQIHVFELMAATALGIHLCYRMALGNNLDRVTAEDTRFRLCNWPPVRM